MKTLVSLRINTDIIDKSDMLAANDDRSRNFIIDRLLVEAVRSLEKKYGIIQIDRAVLENFRKKRNRRNSKSSQKGGIAAKGKDNRNREPLPKGHERHIPAEPQPE